MAEQKKQDVNQLLKVRRDKLADLQANGRDPFQITKFDQTHHSLEVKNLYEACLLYTSGPQMTGKKFQQVQWLKSKRSAE